MRYVEEFRNHELAQRLATAIRKEAQPEHDYRLMEFCGGHTHAIYRYGVQRLLPDNVHFVHGPGCPVCVLPASRLDMAITLLHQHKPILCTYADLLRVPASGRTSLLKVKAAGADVRMVYSTQDALRIARDNPEREVVFFAIGFETTTPPTAVAIKQAQAEGLKNFTVFCNHVLTPAAMRSILGSPQLAIDGMLGPSHVSAIIGSRPYATICHEFNMPVVIAGFEPLDVMQSALMVIRQVNAGRHEVENEYTRVVSAEGNKKAQAVTAEVMALREAFEWRGLGVVEQSALRIKEEYAAFDAEKRFAMTEITSEETKGCDCPDILRGLKRPSDCKLFGTVCTPQSPVGACMVSSEGACAAYWGYGRTAGTAA